MIGVAHNRAVQLDSLRAISIFMVLFSHTISEAYSIKEYYFWEFGAYGVYFFFVLSAFLITSQLLATQDERAARGDSLWPPLMSFYGKRALRLFPAYYLAIGVAALVEMGEMRQELPWHAAQMSDALFALDQHAEYTSPAGHLWSLSIEWQFYLVWPLLVMAAPRRLLLPIILGMLLASAAVWTPFVQLPAVIDRSNWFQSLDSLAMGALLAYAVHRGWRLDWLPRAAIPAALLCVAGLGLPALGHGRMGEYASAPAHELMNFVCAAVVYQATQPFKGLTGKLLDLPPLQYVGKISYGMYVYHGFILAAYLAVCGRLGLPPVDWGVGLTVLLTALSILAAGLSWRFMEEPINRLRRQLDYPPRLPALQGAV